MTEATTTIWSSMCPPVSDDLFDDIEAEFEAALSSGQLHLYFQPVVSLADRSATTLEALPRWDHPAHGVIGPGSFIEPLRHAGLLDEIERWALIEALHQLAQWSGGVAAQLSISVNLSTGHALSDRLVGVVRDTAEEIGVPLRRLGIEIQEAALANKAEAELQALRALGDIGVNFTVDGYTGTIAADLLEMLQTSSVKIARRVIARIPDDAELMDAVTDTILLGRRLGIGVIATGIENPGQAAALREAGCRYGQGFLFSVPMPAEALEERMLQT